MPKHDYPLHPGQTHAEPYYCTIPLEEYESMKKRIAELEKLTEAFRWRSYKNEPPPPSHPDEPKRKFVNGKWIEEENK